MVAALSSVRPLLLGACGIATPATYPIAQLPPTRTMISVSFTYPHVHSFRFSSQLTPGTRHALGQPRCSSTKEVTCFFTLTTICTHTLQCQSAGHHRQRPQPSCQVSHTTSTRDAPHPANTLSVPIPASSSAPYRTMMSSLGTIVRPSSHAPSATAGSLGHSSKQIFSTTPRYPICSSSWLIKKTSRRLRTSVPAFPIPAGEILPLETFLPTATKRNSCATKRVSNGIVFINTKRLYLVQFLPYNGRFLFLRMRDRSKTLHPPELMHRSVVHQKLVFL